MQEIWQPAVKQPKAKDKYREGCAEHHVSWHLHQHANREGAPGLFRLHLSFFTHAAQKKEVRRGVEKTDGAKGEERLAPVAVFGHPATKPAAPNGTGDLRGGER